MQTNDNTDNQLYTTISTTETALPLSGGAGKKSYTSPMISSVRLDNQISLQLQSEPPTFESMNNGNPSGVFKMT